MKRLHQLAAIVLAALWMPIAFHCTLEKLPGLEFLECAADAGPSDCGGNGGDACLQLENPNYKLSDTGVEIPPPPLAVFQALLRDSLSNPVDSRVMGVSESPPEISSTWQFAFRAALPPRAPSCVL